MSSIFSSKTDAVFFLKIFISLCHFPTLSPFHPGVPAQRGVVWGRRRHVTPLPRTVVCLPQLLWLWVRFSSHLRGWEDGFTEMWMGSVKWPIPAANNRCWSCGQEGRWAGLNHSDTAQAQAEAEGKTRRQSIWCFYLLSANGFSRKSCCLVEEMETVWVWGPESVVS